MDSFINQLKAYASQLDQGGSQPRLGTVSSVDPVTATVRVLIQPENVLSGWLPVGSPWAGAGWGIACMPTPGDQVLMLWQEGSAEHGLVIARFWSSSATPPAAPVGELWLVHKTGSYLQLRNDGSIASSASTWKHTGNLAVSGDVSDSYGALSDLRNHYNMHVHPPSDTKPEPTD